MIIKAKHHFILYPLIQLYAIRIVKKNFHSVEIIGSFTDKHLPLLILSNHVSWWDGFWVSYFNSKRLHKLYHYMMLEEQLRKYWFFKYAGGFSVNKSSRSVLETLEYTKNLLSFKENMVLIFPQGKIQSMHQHQFDFQKGLERMIESSRSEIQVLFLANILDYFSNPKPKLSMYVEEYKDRDFLISNMQSRYNKFYQNCIEQQRKREE